MTSLTVKEVLDYVNINGKKKTVEYLKNSSVCQNEELPSDKSFETSIDKLIKETHSMKKSMKRDGSSKLDTVLESNFVFPVATISKRVPKLICDDTLDIKSSFQQNKIKCALLESSLNEEKDKTIQLNHKFDMTVSTLKTEKDIVFQTLVETKKNLKRTAAREKYAYDKLRKIESASISKNETISKDEDDKIVKISFLEKELKKKDDEINQLKVNIDYLEGLLDDNSNEIKVFDEHSKKFSSMIKQCIYELLENQVSASKVSNVIKSVLKLCNKTANRLPSKSSVLKMSLQRLYISQAQISDVFAQESSSVLLTDETSKYNAKFMGYEAADSNGNLWVLGLRDIETKSASDTLKVFKEILNDIDEASEHTENETSKQIMCHIVATLSDRAATEVKFNQLLHDFRKEILPITYENYDTFTDAEKEPLESMCNFFCGLHALVNFADSAKSCIKEVESGIFENTIPCFDPKFRDNDPGTCRLVRTAAKAFGEGSGADEKSGCHGNFKLFAKDFLTRHGLKTVPLRSFRGSRFNILFQNAAAVFFLNTQMKEFLESHGTDNRLLKSILFDLKCVEFLAGSKALGLISKFVTCPLWSVLESKQVSIVDMNEKYLELVTYLDDASRNIRKFMAGELFLFGEMYVEKGPILTALVGTDTFDNSVETFLQVILPVLCKLSKRLFKEHLPGGVLTTMSDEMKDKVKNAPKTSCFAESVFGQLDHLLKTKPNISTLAAEASIMFLNNKTLHWLESKEDEEKEHIISAASKSVRKIKDKYRARLCEIQESRRIALNEKIRKREELQRQKIERQEQFTKNILYHGLWQSEHEVENMLTSYEKKCDKISALKVQLKFRKEVLNQVPEDKTIFNFSKSQDGKKSRKPLDVHELKENLKKLVKHAIVKDLEDGIERHVLVGKRVKHRLTTDEGDKWYTGKVISQVPGYPDWFNMVYDGDNSVYTYHKLEGDVHSDDLIILV